MTVAIDPILKASQDIIEGAQELGVPLEEHVEFCVQAMQARADELGLRGTAQAPA